MNHEIKVENIKCHGCVQSIKSSLLKMPGVKYVEVDIELGIIGVKTSGETSRISLVNKLHQMGYPEPGKGSGITTATSYVSCLIGRVSS